MKRMKLEPNVYTAEEAFRDFIRHCTIGNYAKDTIRHYENTMHNLSLFFDLSNPVTAITKELIEEYTLYLGGKKLTARTIRTYIGGIRTIVKYLAKEGHITDFAITLPKADTTLQKNYSERELLALLKEPNKKTTSFAEYRNWVLVNYFIGTGQRLSTVTNIKIRDVDLDSGVVILRHTKNRKQTILPITEHLAGVLKKYLRYRAGKEDDFLFCNVNGKQMSRGCIIEAIKAFNSGRGVKHHSIHMFRHSFAKMYLLNGGDVFRLQQLLCHADIQTTKSYLNLSTKDLAVNYAEVNPLEVMIKSTARKRITV